MSEQKRPLLNVIYVATNPRGRVLYVGQTSWARFHGWEYCLGQCQHERHSRHRMCEHIAGKDSRARSSRWNGAIDWEAGPIWSRTPVDGMIAYRFVLGAARTDRSEKASIQEHRPLFNKQLVVVEDAA